MRQPKKPAKLTSKDIFNNAQNTYNQGVEKASDQTGVPSKSIDIFDNVSRLNMPNYKGEYSPAPVENAGQSSRVEFGDEGYNSRLGSGLRAEVNPNDLNYETQGGIETAAKFVGTAASGAVMKAAQGIAILGSGIVAIASNAGIGLGNAFTGGALEKLGYSGLDLDDVTSNALVDTLTQSEDWMKKNLFEVYKPTNWDDKNFLEQVSDGAWWGNEGADGVAFALSNFIPAGLLGKAGLGAKAARGLADLGEMNAATKFLTAGRAGLLRSAKIGELADRAVSTAFMTTSESLFEAKDTGETFTRIYLDDYNKRNGTAIDSIDDLDEQSKEDLKAKKGDAMKHTFFANMAALSASNWIEAGLLSKLMGKGNAGALAGEINTGEQFLDPITRIQRKGLDKFFNNTRLGYTAKTVAEQMATEGLYEENIQSAIQNVSQISALNGKIDNMKYIEDVGRQTFANLGDKEAWKSIGSGMVIGGLFGGLGASGIPGVAKGSYTEKENAIKAGVDKLNLVSNNLRSIGQIYKADGTIDTDKMQNYVANLVQAKNLATVHDYYKNGNQENMANIVKNEQLVNYVKGFMEAGLEQDLRTKLKDLQDYKEEDLVKFGFNPIEIDSNGKKVSVQERFKELNDRAEDYIEQSKYIDKAIPLDQRARQGEALSWYARYKELEKIKNDLDTKVIGNTTSSSNSTVDTINNLADRHADLLAELPTQQQYSQPKRVAQTTTELALIEKEISRLKYDNLEEITNSGFAVTEGLNRIEVDEAPEAKSVRQTKKILTQVENAIKDAKDNYNQLIDPIGGEQFYNNLANKVNDIADEEETADERTYNEGDYISVQDDAGNETQGFITRNEAGNLVFGNNVIDDNFLSSNKVIKATEEEISQFKNKAIEDEQIQDARRRIDHVQKELTIINERLAKGKDFLIEKQLEKEDLILNQQNSTVRLTEKQFAKQLKDIEKTIRVGEALIAELEGHRETASNRITELRYLHDNPETAEEVQDLITRVEEEIQEVESSIAAIQPLVDKIKSIYYSMLNTWKSLFPNKEYNSHMDFVADNINRTEEDLELNGNPNSFGGAVLANSLADDFDFEDLKNYTDYKQDLQLTGAEMRALVRDLDELKQSRNDLYNELGKLEDRLAKYKLIENKFNYTKPLRPEVGQKENASNVPAKGKVNDGKLFNDKKKKDISSALFSTAGSHMKDDTLTTDNTQLRWFKFAEEYNPSDKTRRLRTVTINDTDYGLNSENNIFKDDAKEYQNDKHIKVLVVDNENNPIKRDGQFVFTSLIEEKEEYSGRFSNISNKTKEEITGIIKEYSNLLKKAKAAPQYLDITRRSNGIARKGNSISIKQAFGSENIPLKVITEGVTIVNKEQFPLYKGMIYAIYKGRPVALNLRTLTDNEREATLNKLKEYAKIRGNKDSKNSSSSLMEQLKSIVFMGQRIENPELSLYFLKGENKLVFGDSIITHEELLSGQYDIQLDQFLTDINHHVDNASLKKGEYRDIFDKKWDSYQEYLVNERSDAPLTTDLIPASDDINNPQFVNTYLEFSEPKAEQKAKPKTDTKPIKAKRDFSSNLSFASLSDELRNQDVVENKIDKKVSKAVDDIEDTFEKSFNDNDIPGHIVAGTYPSFESMTTIDEDENTTESKSTKKESKTDKAAAEIKKDRAALMAELEADDDFGEDTETEDVPKENKPKVGSDDLFDFDLQLNASRIDKSITIKYSEGTLKFNQSDIKLKQAEAFDEDGSSEFLIFAKDKEIGKLMLDKDNSMTYIGFSNIYRDDIDTNALIKSEAPLKINTRKGVGSVAYELLGNVLKKDFNIDLYSDNLRSESAQALWKKLEREGKAVRVNNPVEGLDREKDYHPYIFRYLADSNNNNPNTYSPINIEAEEKWFKENISSTIPFEKVSGLIKNKAFGMFTRNGQVLISDVATAGTTYHEAFHVVSNLYLTEQQQIDLYNEWKKLNNKEASNLEVEEALAEEFREYMLTNKSEYQSWFSKIISFIKDLLDLNVNQKNELFKRIKEGSFKDAETYYRGNPDLYSNAKIFGATTKKELMDGLTVILFGNLYKAGFNVNNVREFNKGSLGEEKNREFAELYNDSYERMLVDIQNNAPSKLTDGFTKAKFIKLLNNRSVKSDVIAMHAKHLQQNGLKLNLEEDTNLDTLPEGDRARDTLGTVDSIEFSTKNSMPDEVKMLITSLPQAIIKNGQTAAKRNKLGLPVPTDYRRNIAVLHNALANVSSFEEQLENIRKLSTKIPEMAILYRKLNTKDATDEAGFYLQSKFRQQFDKNRYTFFIQLYDGNNSYMVDANSSRMIDVIKAEWQGALRNNTKTIKTEDGIRYLNDEYFNEKYKEFPKKNVDKFVLDFYKDLGITFTNSDQVNTDILADSMQAILATMDTKEITSDIFNKENGIVGYTNRVIEEEIRTSNDYSDNQHINPEGKTVYNISLNDYLSLASTDLNREIPTHLTWNEDTKEGNPLVRNSVWMDKIKKGKKIITLILEGGRIDKPGETGKSTADLTRGEAASLQFTSIMGGFVNGSVAKFPFLRAGDKGLEKGFSFNESTTNMTRQEANAIFRGYLADEMLSAYMLNVEQVGSDIQYYNQFGKGLRTFEGILNAKDIKDATKYMTDAKKSRISAIDLIDKFIERDSIKVAIDNYLDSKVKDNIKELQDSRIISKTQEGFNNIGLPTEIVSKFAESNELTNGEMTNMMEQFSYLSLIANIEQTKLYTGDTAFYKDFFKRTSGLVGTGKTTWIGEQVDKLLNTLFPRSDEKQSDSLLQSWIYNDVEAASNSFNEYVDAYVEAGFTKVEAEKILQPYKENNEADAQGYMTLPEYREFNLRIGDWNDDREAVYQKAILGKRLAADDILMLNPEKPQMFAPQNYDGLYVPTFYKLSVLPLIPSMIKGRTLEKLNNSMLTNKVGLAMFESANKVGARNRRNFYTAEGDFNTTDTEISHTISYKYFKKQLDINPEGKDKVIFGTQFRKLILSGAIGKVLNIGGKKTEGTEVIKEFNRLVDKQVKMELNKLVKKLGITETGKDTFKISNVDVLREMLEDESLKRASPDNMVESISQIFRQGDVKPIELSVNRNKIEQILMSLVNNNVIKQKVRGGMLVQAASTGFETGVRKQSDITNEKWASNLETLQFYKPTKGKTTAMQVYLPYKFKEMLDGGLNNPELLDNRLKQLIAFRIPTQGLNSIEALDIKGFLPLEAGDIIITPTEGVTKSGWDFDVDKLNVFLPNYTMEEGKPVYVEGEDNLAGVQNKIIALSRQILLDKENFVSLTTPNTTQDLLDMEKEITSLNPALGRNENERSKFVDWAYNLGIRQTYLIGKTGVGRAALQNVNHVMAQIADLKMKLISPVYLQHNSETTEEGLVADLSKNKDVLNSKTTIQDIISQTLNGFVDIARDPFLKTLNITPETSSVFFFLTRIGVPLRDTTLFLNQPIIRDYLTTLETGDALYLDEDNTIQRDAIPEIIYSKWGSPNGLETEEEKAEAVKEKSLKIAIKDGGKDNVQQWEILNQYLYYKELSDNLDTLINAINFDTTSSSSIESARTKVETYFDLLKEEKFVNMGKLINETFLGSFAKATRSSVNLYKDLFITESNQHIRKQLNRLKNDVKAVRGLDLEKFMTLAKNDVISYLFQNSKLTNDGSKLGNNIATYFVDKTNNIANTLSVVKDSETLKDNYLIRELVPILPTTNKKQAFDSNDVFNIKMFTKRLSTEEQNLVTDAWRELFEFQGNDEFEADQIQGFATDLLAAAILQSGLNNSPLSFTQFAPSEYYVLVANKFINNAINDNIDSEGEDLYSDFYDKFYRNNVQSNDVVPKRKGKIKEDGSMRAKTERPFIKKWNKANKDWRFFRNTFEMDGESYIFVETNKLGAGFNFKEYASSTSVLAGNNGTNNNLLPVEKGSTTKNRMLQELKASDLNDATKSEYAKRIKEAKDIQEVADIQRELCQ